MPLGGRGGPQRWHCCGPRGYRARSQNRLMRRCSPELSAVCSRPRELFQRSSRMALHRGRLCRSAMPKLLSSASTPPCKMLGRSRNLSGCSLSIPSSIPLISCGERLSGDDVGMLFLLPGVFLGKRQDSRSTGGSTRNKGNLGKLQRPPP